MGYVIRISDSASINGIRQLVSGYLTAQDLPDSLIDSPVFERAAELRAYKLLGYANDDAYLAAIGFNRVTYEFPRTFTYEGSYTSGTAYQENDIVYSGTTLYYANKAIASAPATLDADDWTQIPVQFKGVYTTGANYQQYDVIDDSGNLYYANKAIASAPATRVIGDWVQVQQIVQTAAQRLTEERVRLAVQYLTAIRLIPAIPQLVEEQILRERVRYQDIDWERRIELYEQEYVNAIEDEVPDAVVFTDARAIFGQVNQYTAF